jgi:DNA-binding LytR/AlgR family response regulator
MNYIIIDDEPIARQGIKLLADQLSYLNYIAEYPNPIVAHEHITEDIDLLFLDIEMPGLNGLEYLRRLHPQIAVILTTAYPQHALEAFELDVVDYLVKPVKFARFIKAVDKAQNLQELQKDITEVELHADEIYVKADRKYHKVNYADILYIKGMKDYVMIHTTSHKYMTALNLSTIMKQLPQKLFARISKSYIINTQHIVSVGLDYVDIAGSEITLGNSYKEDFINTHVKKTLLKR